MSSVQTLHASFLEAIPRVDKIARPFISLPNGAGWIDSVEPELQVDPVVNLGSQEKRYTQPGGYSVTLTMLPKQARRLADHLDGGKLLLPAGVLGAWEAEVSGFPRDMTAPKLRVMVRGPPMMSATSAEDLFRAALASSFPGTTATAFTPTRAGWACGESGTGQGAVCGGDFDGVEK